MLQTLSKQTSFRLVAVLSAVLAWGFATTSVQAMTYDPAQAVVGSPYIDTNLKEVTMKGSINAQGAWSAYFVYSDVDSTPQCWDADTAGYQTVRVAGVYGAGSGVSAKATGIRPERLYHYRLCAKHTSTGSVLYSAIQQFQVYRPTQQASLVQTDIVQNLIAQIRLRLFGN